MLQLNNVSDFAWRRLVERLDKGVAEAARRYLSNLHARHVPIRSQSWVEELEELRLAREPRYDMPGLPLAYALRYMPRRTLSILGSLATLAADRYPTTVLDVGSGTGATALAMDLMNSPRHISLLGIESSPEMIRFAESTPFQGRVTPLYNKGSLYDDSLANASIQNPDLVVISAAFPYRFKEWDPLIQELGSQEVHQSTMILAVEPDAKADILDSLARRLRVRGWRTEWLCCHDLPDAIRREDIALRNTQDVWKRIGAPGSTPPRTWWSPPHDKILIANPEPSWPALGDSSFPQVEVVAAS
jgi:SAM-dependent methyltransferase